MSSNSDDEALADIAAKEIAGAFSTIEEWKEYIPAEIYNRIGDAVTDWLNESDWTGDPDLLLKAAPHIFRKILRTAPE